MPSCYLDMKRQRRMFVNEVSETKETMQQPNNNYHFFCHDSNCNESEDMKHFSYYSTDTEKLVHRLDCEQHQTKSFNPCAFPSWSPIASNFEMMPGNAVARNVDEDTVAAASVSVSTAASSATANSPSPSNEKPSYSDILSKSPANNQQAQINVSSIGSMKAKSHCHSSSDSRHDRDGNRKQGGKPLGSCKWVSLDDLDNDGGGQWRPNSSSKAKTRGQSSPELVSNRNVDGKCSKLKDQSMSSKGCVKNPAKKSSGSLSFMDLDGEFEDQEIDGEVDNSGFGQEKLFEVPSVVDPRIKKPSNHRRNGNAAEKSNKESNRKQTIRKKKTNSSNRNLDYLTILITHLHLCGLMIGQFGLWLINLITDVSVMSGNLLWHMMQIGYGVGKEKSNLIWNWAGSYYNRLLVRLGLDSASRKSSSKTKADENISLPLTREEAMKRLLSCKGKDPYSILGVSPSATDDDIKKYYKKQAFLVHPDKNRILGAEEAFKVLAHAFDLIGEPNKRREYDLKRLEAQQIEATWNEFSDLLTQLQEKMSEVANTIKCTNCNAQHRRVKLDRPCYSARFCSPCKIMHGAREGDIWAESRFFGFLWNYFACMDGAVYDITDWAACQYKNLMHLRANTHNVQYRIISSKNNSTHADAMPSDATLEELMRAFQKKCCDPSSSSSSTHAAKPDTNSNRKKRSKRK